MTLRPSESCRLGGRQVRVSLSGGMKPASPRALSATRPLGRMVSHVMLPLFRPIRSHPSGGNCRALPERRGEDERRLPSCLCVMSLWELATSLVNKCSCTRSGY